MISSIRHQCATDMAHQPAWLRLDGQTTHRPAVCALTLLVADTIAVFAVVLVVFWWFGLFGDVPYQTSQSVTGLAIDECVVFGLATLAYFFLKGRYIERSPFWYELRLLVSAGAGISLVALAFGVLNHAVVPQFPVALVFLLFPIMGLATNRIARYLLSQAGVWAIPIVILGDGAAAAAVESALERDPSLGYYAVGRIDTAALIEIPESLNPHAMLLQTMLNRLGGSRLFIAMEAGDAAQQQVIACALREQVPFAVVPQENGVSDFGSGVSRFLSHDDATLSFFRNELSRPISQLMKSILDVAIAGLMLALVSPLFLAIAVAGLVDGGPVFFAHRRVGAGGRAFFCLKFRTMVPNSDHVLEAALARDPALAEEWRATRKLIRDPRVTIFGQFLRKTSLDELPQLINVLRREMSLVGPRPIVESEIVFYGKDIAQYYSTRPGLTGLWQVSGRSSTSYARRVQLDVWYVNNWTIWQDLAVLLKTIPVVLLRHGAC